MKEWKDLGRIFSIENNSDWMFSHSSLPCALDIGEDNYRVYFSTRNESGHSQPGAFEINLNDPHRITNLSKEPVLKVGKPGYFDSDGIYMTSVIRDKDKVFAYYGGWTSHRGGAFSSEIGLAISEDDGKTFNKYFDTPIIQRNMFDPWALLAPSVYKIKDLWVLFYSTGSSLNTCGAEKKSNYHCSFATSSDGIRWSPTGIVCMGENGISNISRVSLGANINGVYEMFYSFVQNSGGKYELGYAQSNNGFIYSAKPHNFYSNLRAEKWRSESICYPYVFTNKDKQYMLYNGNEFGKSGIGLAVRSL